MSLTLIRKPFIVKGLALSIAIFMMNSAQDATEQEQNIVIANFKSNHLDVAKNNPYKAPFVKGRVTFEYIYKNELDSTLFSYEIKPEDYIE